MADENVKNWQLLSFEKPAGVQVQSLLGKKVLTPDGEEIGKVGDVCINPETFEAEYIKINKGMFSKDYYVHRNYVSAISDEAAMLSIVPVDEFRGKKVYGSDAKEVGKVKEVNRIAGTNTLVTMAVDTGLGSREITISESDICSLGENVVLFPTKDEVMGRSGD